MVSLKHHDRAVRSIRADQINKRLGDDGAVWPAQRGQLLYHAMACRNDRAAAPDLGNSISTNGIETVKQESDADRPPAGGVVKNTSGARL